jgi:uncharacterized membrane protein YkoI
MRISTIVLTLALASVSATAGLAESSKHEMTQAQLQAEAKITEAQAREIAIARVPKGSIKAIELEIEGALLIWSVDMATPGTKDITEVQVNAKTGAVVAVEIETPQDEKKEKDGHGKEAPPKASH